MSALISVIVPIYNIEQYIKQCVDSILNQTYDNLEIILVDDGSPDNCGKICDEYASLDSRIRVIHKNNGGLSSARNAGLDIASGEWISFIDGDDWLEKNMYQILLDTALSTGADISACGLKLVKNEVVESRHDDMSITEVTSFDIFKEILNGRLRFEVWNKLFRKSVIGDVRFIIGQTYEDVYFDRAVFSRVQKVSYINSSLYCYRVARPGSTVSTFKLSRLVIFNELYQIVSYLKEQKQYDLSQNYALYAAETAITFYEDAVRLQCSKNVLRLILKHFDDSIKLLDRLSIKCLLFKFSPSLYLVIQRLRNHD